MTPVTKDRFIVTVFKRPDNRYYVKTIDTIGPTRYYFFVLPNGSAATPATRLDHPGSFARKEDLPHRIVKAITAYLEEIENGDALQTVMNLQ
jgi:hypothetical protein